MDEKPPGSVHDESLPESTVFLPCDYLLAW